MGPALGPNASLRAIRQKREIETRGDQDNQDKNDLQGKIQFYQQFCASQQNVVVERKTKLVVGHSQLAGNETMIRANPCQFSTFKSSPGKAAAPDTSSLDLMGLNLGHREIGFKHTELNPATSRDYYQPISRTRERSPNAASRQLDKQSYFFHGHKTEKNVDREVVMFEDLGMNDYVLKDRRTNDADDVAVVSGGSMNCFGDMNKEKGFDYNNKKLKYVATNMQHLTMAYEIRRDSSNIEFLEKEGELFKKSSSELLQEVSTSKRRNFSFCKKEKTYRSLESLEKSIDLPAMDWKSLDLLPEDRPITFFHIKQKSFDSSQKSMKKSIDSATHKMRKRPSFFQRVGRSLHFLSREREKCQDYPKREKQQINNQYLQSDQTDQKKCEYFLQRHQKNIDFFAQTPNVLASRAPVQCNLGPFNKHDDDEDAFVEKNSTLCYLKNNVVQLEDSTFHMMENKNDFMKIDTVSRMKRNIENTYSGVSESVRSGDGFANNTELLAQSRLLDPVASIITQETVSGNKDSLEIGYSISQLGRLYLQNLQQMGHREGGLQSLEIANLEKRDCYMEWIRTRDDLDVLSHGTNSSDSLAHGKPQGNLDILKGILLDIFVCICI